jgi:hypothetical protein
MTMNLTTQLIRESVEFLEGSREDRTVKQIIIRAGKSKNDRNYPHDVVRASTPLFEGVKTYANHPSKDDLKNRPERSISDITGWISDVSFDESMSALVGTRHFADTSAGRDAWALAQQVIFEGAPTTLFGASINAMGRGNKKDGILEVAEITRAISVDDVTTPAAGGGFLPLGESDGGIVEAVLQEMTFMEFFEARPDYIKRIQNEMKTERQDEAVKAAKAEADQLREALETLQSDVYKVNENHVAALIDLEQARLDLVIEKTLNKVRLPADWRESLRQQLTNAKPDDWDRIIQEEQQKAKHVSKPIVTNANRQVQAERVAPKPIVNQIRVRENEDFDTWLKRQHSQ